MKLKSVEKTFCLAARVILVSALLFYYSLWGFAPNPNYFFAHEGLFFKGIRELASLGSLDAKSNQKNQEIPEAISCADQKTKAKKCPRLPLFFTPLSSFAGGNFG